MENKVISRLKEVGVFKPEHLSNSELAIDDLIQFTHNAAVDKCLGITYNNHILLAIPKMRNIKKTTLSL